MGRDVKRTKQNTHKKSLRNEFQPLAVFHLSHFIFFLPKCEKKDRFELLACQDFLLLFRVRAYVCVCVHMCKSGEVLGLLSGQWKLSDDTTSDSGKQIPSQQRQMKVRRRRLPWCQQQQQQQLNFFPIFFQNVCASCFHTVLRLYFKFFSY